MASDVLKFIGRRALARIVNSVSRGMAMEEQPGSRPESYTLLIVHGPDERHFTLTDVPVDTTARALAKMITDQYDSWPTDRQMRRRHLTLSVSAAVDTAYGPLRVDLHLDSKLHSQRVRDFGELWVEQQGWFEQQRLVGSGAAADVITGFIVGGVFLPFFQALSAQAATDVRVWVRRLRARRALARADRQVQELGRLVLADAGTRIILEIPAEVLSRSMTVDPPDVSPSPGADTGATPEQQDAQPTWRMATWDPEARSWTVRAVVAPPDDVIHINTRDRRRRRE